MAGADAESGIGIPAPGIQLLDIRFGGRCPARDPDQLAGGVFDRGQFPGGFNAGFRGKGGFRIAFDG